MREEPGEPGGCPADPGAGPGLPLSRCWFYIAHGATHGVEHCDHSSAGQPRICGPAPTIRRSASGPRSRRRRRAAGRARARARTPGPASTGPCSTTVGPCLPPCARARGSPRREARGGRCRPSPPSTVTPQAVGSASGLDDGHVRRSPSSTPAAGGGGAASESSPRRLSAMAPSAPDERDGGEGRLPPRERRVHRPPCSSSSPNDSLTRLVELAGSDPSGVANCRRWTKRYDHSS